jgi:hypothetical protein
MDETPILCRARNLCPQALFPEFGLVAAAARIESRVLAALAADVPGKVQKHPDHEGDGHKGRNEQKQSQVKINRHISPRPSVSPPIAGPKLDQAKSAETGHLQEKPDGVNREQSESKGFINLVEIPVIAAGARGGGLGSPHRGEPGGIPGPRCGTWGTRQFIHDLKGDSGHRLTVGIGGPVTCIQHSSNDGEPP